jgi:predicted DNA-binding WGR domain protein/pentose-5-phosphate-3-epimerase
MNATVRHFVFKDEKASKFWEITQTGGSVMVRYGKTGTSGQSQTKEFADAASASKHAQKLVAEKLGKGYVEQGVATVPAVDTVNATSVTETAVPKPKQDAAKAKAVIPAKPKSQSRDPEAVTESLMALLDKDDATNRVLARHPKASADLLEKLSHSSDKTTRQAVTGNPNTPPETLVRLGQQFPKEFLANPALDLMLMVNPGLMEQVSVSLLIRLLKQTDSPASMLIWAAGHETAKVQLAVAMNASAPLQALQLLRQSRHPVVREAVLAQQAEDVQEDPEKGFEQAVRDRLGSMNPSDLREAWSHKDVGLAQWNALPLWFRLAEATKSHRFSAKAMARVLLNTGWSTKSIRELLPNYDGWDEVALDPSTPVHVLEALTNDADKLVRLGVAENPKTPIHVLEALANDPEVKWQVVQNPATPVHVLEALADDANREVRQLIGKNTQTPAHALETLANDENETVRVWVAENPKTPINVLGAMANDSSSWIRLSVAKNPATPVPMKNALLETLAKDAKVMDLVAGSPAAPIHVLESLAKGSDFSVLQVLALNPATPAHVLKAVLVVLAKNSYYDIPEKIARNPATHTSVLEILASDRERDVRRGLAQNPVTPLHIRESLAKDPDSFVRVGVAENPATPIHVRVSLLEALASDASGSVRKAVAGNPSTAPDVLLKLVADRDSEVVIEVLRNPNTPLAVLSKQISAKAVSLRLALATQAYRSPEILKALWKDANEDVRQAVGRCQGLTSEMVDEMVVGIEFERDLTILLEHPNTSANSVEIIAAKLFNTPAIQSAWYQKELAKASAEVRSAALLSYCGKDPNKAVLTKRAMAPVMALCAGALIEPSRLVKVVGSTDWLVRAGVARNRGTPANLLKKLSADAHPLVSALAKKALVGKDKK